MNQPSDALVNEFAVAFAQKGKGKGLTKEEILSFFRRYSSNVVDPGFYGMTLTKQKLFHHCLERLHVEDQYRALIDLATQPPESANQVPTEAARQGLVDQLRSHGAANGVTLRAAGISSWELRREWIKAIGRIEKNPDAAITTARTPLERACKDVIFAHDPDSSMLREGDVPRLVAVARKVVGLEGGADAVSSGIGSLAHGIDQRSNAAGDRHAAAEPSIPAVAEARFFCDVALAPSLLLVEQHQVSIPSA